MLHPLLRITVSSGLLFLLGCGSSGLIGVTGEVTWQNQPIERGLIRFVPVDGKGPSAASEILAGRYSAAVAPGQKRIEISSFKIARIPFNNEPGAPIINMPEGQLLPPMYNSQSTLTAEVGAVGGPLNFRLP